MKVLFAYSNINGFHADSFGDGIAMIMAVTKKAGHNVRQIQLFNKNEYSKLDSAVKEFKPDVVGFTSVSSQFGFVHELSKGCGAPPRCLLEDFATISDGFGPPFGGNFGAILEPCRPLAGKSGHADSHKGGLERGPESGSKKGPFWSLPGGRQEGSLLHDSSIFTFLSLSLGASFLPPF